ncbi:MAG: hypothetical protein FWB95_09445 [Treponema sp.]|nr:hypothetical protein [Treponema sp.]
MKKLVLVLALVAVISVGTAFAHPDGWGIGLQGGGGLNWVGFGFGGGSALTLKAPTVPIYWGIYFDFYAGFDGFGWIAGLTADYYFLDLPFASNWLHFYIGAGGAFGFGILYQGLAIDLKARLPIGLSLQIPIKSGLDVLEFYFQLVPSAGVRLGFFDPFRASFAGGLGFDVGFRLWF